MFNISTKSNHYLVCNSVMSFEAVPINVSFATIRACVNIVKSVYCHLRESSLANPMFTNLNTVPSLNVCNVVKICESSTSYSQSFSSQA